MTTAAARVPTQDGEALVREYVMTKDAHIRDRAVKAFLPLVKYIAGRINITEFGVLRRDDLYQYGIVGLLSALDRFEVDRGASFKTFAYRRIHGEIIDAIRREGLMSKDTYRHYRRLQDETDSLRQELGRDPTPQEVGDRLGMTVPELEHLQSMMDHNNVVSLDESVSSDDDHSMIRRDVLADEEQISPDQEFGDKALKDELKRIITTLPERQRLILALYYYEELTLADIGVVLGLSESRISQIMTQTLADIREALRDKPRGGGHGTG